MSVMSNETAKSLAENLARMPEHEFEQSLDYIAAKYGNESLSAVHHYMLVIKSAMAERAVATIH